MKISIVGTVRLIDVVYSVSRKECEKIVVAKVYACKLMEKLMEVNGKVNGR